MNSKTQLLNNFKKINLLLQGLNQNRLAITEGFDKLDDVKRRDLAQLPGFDAIEGPKEDEDDDEYEDKEGEEEKFTYDPQIGFDKEDIEILNENSYPLPRNLYKEKDYDELLDDIKLDRDMLYSKLYSKYGWTSKTSNKFDRNKLSEKDKKEFDKLLSNHKTTHKYKDEVKRFKSGMQTDIHTLAHWKINYFAIQKLS